MGTHVPDTSSNSVRVDRLKMGKFSTYVPRYTTIYMSPFRPGPRARRRRGVPMRTWLVCSCGDVGQHWLSPLPATGVRLVVRLAGVGNSGWARSGGLR
eukprot:9424601-Pyramimonas_sp.AAC.2